MVIGDRLRALREDQKLSQGDIEKRTGLLRCYVSRVENGHTVPSIETLEKFARALEAPTYKLFYEGDEPPRGLRIPTSKIGGENLWGSKGTEANTLRKFRKLFEKISEHNRRILIHAAQKMQKR